MCGPLSCGFASGRAPARSGDERGDRLDGESRDPAHGIAVDLLVEAGRAVNRWRHQDRIEAIGREAARTARCVAVCDRVWVSCHAARRRQSGRRGGVGVVGSAGTVVVGAGGNLVYRTIGLCRGRAPQRLDSARPASGRLVEREAMGPAEDPHSPRGWLAGSGFVLVAVVLHGDWLLLGRSSARRTLEWPRVVDAARSTRREIQRALVLITVCLHRGRLG